MWDIIFLSHVSILTLITVSAIDYQSYLQRCVMPDNISKWECSTWPEPETHLLMGNCTQKEENVDSTYYQILNTLNCCYGAARCHRSNPKVSLNNFKTHGSFDIHTVVCFSETSCLKHVLNSTSHEPLLNNANEPPHCFGVLHKILNVTNAAGQSTFYTCYNVSVDNRNSCCIRAECTGFSMLERKCWCSEINQSCLCYNNCDIDVLNSEFNTQAIFFSFSDSFSSKGVNSFSVVLTAVFATILIIFIILVLMRINFMFRLLKILTNYCSRNPDNIEISNLSSERNFTLPYVDNHHHSLVSPPPSYDEAVLGLKS